MPQNKAPTSRDSGSDPDKGKLRPTVVRPPTGRARTPTKTGKGLQEEAPVRPTVMATASVGKRNSRAPATPQRPEAVKKPTAIPGVERKRIMVELADLRRLSSQAKPSVLEKALRLVQTFVVKGSSDRQAVLWGHSLQQDYSNLVSRTLELSQVEVLRRVTGYIGRMIEILGSIDLEAVCGVVASSGMLGQYFKKVNRKIDTPEELDVARIELDQLVRLMGEALEQLLSFKETLEQHARRIEEVGDEVEASALAAEFLAAHLREGQQALSRRFLERSMSLMQTVAQIRGNTSIREVQIEQPLRLIGAIQNVALVMVPGWLGSIAALSAMLDGRRKPTATEAGELAYQLRNIVQQLTE